MQLPKDILSGQYRKPNIYLCQTNKEKIGKLEVTNLNGTFKWNEYSEISFDIGRTYIDDVTGETLVNPYYDLVQGLRLVYLEGYGYFQLQDPEINGDGIQEQKTINAYSSEYDMSQKYLETFIINNGVAGSIDDVQLYDEFNTEKSLLNLVIDRIPNWTIGHVDNDLMTQERSFEIDRVSVYDFLMNDMCNTFKCVIIFDTLKNEINVYKEETAGSETDVYISFDNLANNIKINYSTDDIKTVLTVKGADDVNIREINFGLPHITNLSYYHTVEWMGQDLYDAYEAYLQKINNSMSQYNGSLSDLMEYNKLISNLNSRVGENVTTSKLEDLNSFLDEFYNPNATDTTYEEKLSTLKEEFQFIGDTNINSFYNDMLNYDLSQYDKELSVYNFLNQIWDEYGLSQLRIQENSYKGVQTTQAEGGMSEKSNDSYYLYQANYLLLKSVENEIFIRENEISNAERNRDILQQSINNIAIDISTENNFTDEQLTRLSPFLREDEYTDDCFVITDSMSEDERLEVLNNLLDISKKELEKMSQPKLSFTTDMANIFALKEFEPIHDQFALGNMIKIALRPDYIKKSRLLEVDINFEDFSDFSVTFGDLISVRSQADVHADLLSRAISAGKSVSKNSSNWQKGYDTANEIRKKVNSGLLDAATSIRSIDGAQNSFIDNYGIHLQAKDENGSISPEQIWLVNNKIIYSDDGFKSSKSVFGKFNYDSDGDGVMESHSGLLADAIIGGYVEGSAIKGGTIKIGDRGDGTYAFEVHQDGSVSMKSGGSKIGNSTVEEIDHFTSSNMYRVEIKSNGSQMMTKKGQTAVLTCKVYSWDNDITDTLDSARFNWKRTSENSDQDAIWNANTRHIGKKEITITTEDILYNASFNCEVDLPD